MDSLDAVEAAFEFEEQYGMEIADNIREFRAVQDIVDYINNRLSATPEIGREKLTRE